MAGNGPPEPWLWVRRAATTALVLIVIGWVVGLTGAVITPRFGLLVGAIGLFLLGGGWAASRVGLAGVAAGLMGCIAAAAMAVESHHFIVAGTASVVELPSLAAWDPDSDVIAAHVPEVQALRAQQATARVRSGSGKTATTNIQVVTPLLDTTSGGVAGFHCTGDKGPQRGDGSYVLSTAAWSGDGPPNCVVAVDLAIRACEQAGIRVDPGARTRFVEVFASRTDLRSAYDLRVAVAVPLVLFVVYLAVVVVMRDKGASRKG